MPDQEPARRLTPRYYELVAEFPLESIRDDTHYDAAEAVMHRLLQERLDAGGQAYLDALSDLVMVYDDKHYPIDPPPPGEMLAGLLEDQGMSQADLVRATGIARSTVSAIIAGKRRPTSHQMARLGMAFKVPPAVFLPVSG